MPPAGGERSAVRKNQYNLHIRLDEDERAALEKGLQASGLPLSAYLRKLILGESVIKVYMQALLVRILVCEMKQVFILAWKAVYSAL